MYLMPRFISRLTAQIIFFLCFILSAPTAFADLSDADKSEIKSIIEEFIKENPVIIRDVLTQLATAEQAQRKLAALALVKNDDGETALHFAAMYIEPDYVNILNLLIEKN